MSGKGTPPCDKHGGGRRLDAGGAYRHPHSTLSGAKRQGPRHGQVRGDVWTKSARASVHMVRVPKAWALDVTDLDAARAVGVQVVHIHDLEQLAHYWAALDIVTSRGFKMDRGFGEQVALPIEHWRPTRGAAEALARRPEPESESEPIGPELAKQLSLFGA